MCYQLHYSILQSLRKYIHTHIYAYTVPPETDQKIAFAYRLTEIKVLLCRALMENKSSKKHEHLHKLSRSYSLY